MHYLLKTMSIDQLITHYTHYIVWHKSHWRKVWSWQAWVNSVHLVIPSYLMARVNPTTVDHLILTSQIYVCLNHTLRSLFFSLCWGAWSASRQHSICESRESHSIQDIQQDITGPNYLEKEGKGLIVFLCLSLLFLLPLLFSTLFSMLLLVLLSWGGGSCGDSQGSQEAHLLLMNIAWPWSYLVTQWRLTGVGLSSSTPICDRASLKRTYQRGLWT